MPRSRLPPCRAPTGENGKHRSSLERWCAFDNGDIGHPRGDTPHLIAGNSGMGRFATAEAPLDLYFAALLEKAAGRAPAHLQVMVVGAGPQSHFFALRDVLILL